ncbi:hypothetical protein BST61_g8954 [Cercospora zeina]
MRKAFVAQLLPRMSMNHFIRECGDIDPIWIPGKDNPADLFTEALPKATFQKGSVGMGTLHTSPHAESCRSFVYRTI